MLRLLTVAALLCIPNLASAQLTDLREHARRIDHLDVAVGLDLGVYVGDQPDGRSVSVAPSPGFALRLWKAVVELSVPLAVLRQDSFLDGRVRRTRPGNVWLGVSYLPDRACGLTRLTLGMGAPSARADDPFDQQTLSLAGAVHGSWDSYLWMENLLPLVIGYQTTLPLGDKQMARLTGEGDLAIGLPGGNREGEFGMQWAGEASVGRTVRFGARAGATYWPTLGGDNFQSSLGVALTYAGRKTLVSTRFVMNLDGPSGFAFASAGVWGVQAALVRSF